VVEPISQQQHGGLDEAPTTLKPFSRNSVQLVGGRHHEKGKIRFWSKSPQQAIDIIDEFPEMKGERVILNNCHGRGENIGAGKIFDLVSESYLRLANTRVESGGG